MHEHFFLCVLLSLLLKVFCCCWKTMFCVFCCCCCRNFLLKKIIGRRNHNCYTTTIETWTFVALIDLNISHEELVPVNDMLKKSNDTKETIQNLGVLFVCYFHAMYVIHSEYTFYSCLNVKEPLVWNRHDI